MIPKNLTKSGRTELDLGELRELYCCARDGYGLMNTARKLKVSQPTLKRIILEQSEAGFHWQKGIDALQLKVAKGEIKLKYGINEKFIPGYRR